MTSCWGARKRLTSQQGKVAWCIISVGWRVGSGLQFTDKSESTAYNLRIGSLIIWVEAHLLPFLIREHLAFIPHRSSQSRKLCSQSQYWIIKAEGRGAKERLGNLGSKWVQVLSTPHTWPSFWIPATYLPWGEGNPFCIKLEERLPLQPLSATGYGCHIQATYQEVYKEIRLLLSLVN